MQHDPRASVFSDFHCPMDKRASGHQADVLIKRVSKTFGQVSKTFEGLRCIEVHFGISGLGNGSLVLRYRKSVAFGTPSVRQICSTEFRWSAYRA